MAKSANQKLKLLHLVCILEEQTDEEHPLTVQQLIAALQQKGIAAERKSVYDDIETLQQFGLDIVVQKGRSNSYFMGQRSFQIPELKLLVDAAQSAKFITEKKSAELIKKISSLASRHQATQLRRQVHVQGRVKTMNESIYYTVDTLQAAINQNSSITCRYYEWVVDAGSARRFSRRWRRDGAPYEISPWTLIWDDENYYLLGFDAGAGIIKHYRVDKMADIKLTGVARAGRAAYEKLDIAEYATSTFGMFGGVQTDVKLRFNNRLIGVVVDRFGKDVRIQPEGDEYFVLWIKAVVSPQFISWVMGFGGEAKVLSPPAVARQMAETAQQVQSQYGPAE